MTERIPELRGVISSEVLEKYLDAVFPVRKAFIQCEADGCIGRALRYQIRAIEDIFNPGDKMAG